MLGKDREEEEERDNNRKDIFWRIKEDEVMDYLLKFYCRFRSFLYALNRSGSVLEIGLGFPETTQQSKLMPQVIY